MKSNSKFRVYTGGIERKGIGAYSYVVLEVEPGEHGGEIVSMRSRFAQAGASKNALRMKMRAFYEGVRHCPDGAEAEVLSDYYSVKELLETTGRYDENGDIAERYRQYVGEHNVNPSFCLAEVYADDDLPCDGHQEWTWMANQLCEDAIKQYLEQRRHFYS